MADKAELLTPLMRHRRRRRAAKAFGVLLLLGLTLLVAIVLMVNDGRNYRRLAEWLGVEEYLARPFAAAPPPALRARRMTRVVDAPPRLIDPAVGRYDRFRVLPRLTSHERCERLGEDGPAANFQAAGGEWECLFSKELGTTAEPSVLFAQIKGTSSSTFRTFRLKLSLLDPRQDEEMFRLVANSLDRFGLELTPENRRYLNDRIRAGDTFSSRLEGYRISYDRERDDDRRSNLLITQIPQISACSGPIPISRGYPMQSSTAPIMLECLPLPKPRLSRPIQAD
ncbi:hypothetical protein JNB91_08780 [Rhizobium wenxiniae]|uniref:DUF6030 family protein n=1 Tax=Rhizobium wenxiniae TaxID=1737357 RepID=UPI001C6F35FF|nr:DUF6030 family protein [Rhizobium wenxiniae]MBW9087939.1 hypothetical protein [Rhizobium wenxiniae]